MNDANQTDDVAEPESASEAPRQYKKVKHTPLTEEDGWTVLSAAAGASGAIALAALFAEVATDAWLAQTLGLGLYVTTPLGVGATFLTGLVARDRGVKASFIPAALVAAYWLVYLVTTFF